MAWKLGVTALALCIKVGGNKLLLGLIGDLVSWLTDDMLYGYEITTSILVRVLQLSIPDEDTAQKVGLTCAIVEVMVRIFFYNMFLKAGLKNPRMAAEEKVKYAKRGKLRVQDASNDMVVEYVSSITAGLLMVYLAPTGAFTFATNTAVSTKTIVTLCAYQIVPELFLDFYVTFMEVYGGLKEMHQSYWKHETGAHKGAKEFVHRGGDLAKATLLKFIAMVSTVAFVLLACLK
ncbi:hypothetical protein TeGR_g6663 [Tetraparma gracilis]|uniref:Uncharacterized protein n=1 Tax=Tetraparma gracilis TaxID=2962635 RepID=A0ABQ6MZB5_9STRA|nr:hypothetical protein TeGR_g6663 [Tetraparma gracilis]